MVFFSFPSGKQIPVSLQQKKIPFFQGMEAGAWVLAKWMKRVWPASVAECPDTWYSVSSSPSLCCCFGGFRPHVELIQCPGKKASSCVISSCPETLQKVGSDWIRMFPKTLCLRSPQDCAPSSGGVSLLALQMDVASSPCAVLSQPRRCSGCSALSSALSCCPLSSITTASAAEMLSSRWL